MTTPARAAGMLGLAGVPAHAWLLAAHSHGAPVTAVLAAMTLWCAACAAGSLRRGPAGRRALSGLLAMAGAMALAHAALFAGLPGLGGGHHHAGAASAARPVPPGGDAAMVAVVGLELAVALGAALALRRTPPQPAG